MELKGIIVDKNATELKRNWFDFYVLEASKNEFLNDALEKKLRKLGLCLDEVLLLCPDNDWVLVGKANGVATLAYAKEGSSYSFPNAEFVVEGVEQLEKRDFIRRFQREKKLPWLITTTERLNIREETPADAETLYRIYESPSIKRFLQPLYPELEQEKKYLADYYKYIYRFFEYGIWHLELKETHQSIGRAGLTPKHYDDGAQGAELGYLLDEKYQGQGYCMEACKEILRYAKMELELDKVYCLIRPDNHHSIRICEKLGFVFDKEIFSEERVMRRYLKYLKYDEKIRINLEQKINK